MDEREYLVVRNDEEQYSVWLSGRALPAGWFPAGFAGTKDACLSYVDSVWVDTRPRSLREVDR